MNVAKSPTEQLRELFAEVAVLRERDAAREREVEDLRTLVHREQEGREREREARTALERDLATVRQGRSGR